MVKKAGLDGIEWGGDIHVPHGDIKQANEVCRMTKAEGLEIASYGSYYKVGCGARNQVEFEAVIETAVALQAPVVRVWAGDKASGEADETFWNEVVKDSVNIAELAQKAGVKVAFEYHEDTLTDTSESACRLLNEINHKNMGSYWQTHMESDHEARLEGLIRVAPWILNVHIFSWINNQRAALAESAGQWKEYMEIIRRIDSVRYCMIEFVKDNCPDQFLSDAETLKHLLEKDEGQ